MSNLESLIEDLCPNGVEYKTLGEIAQYSMSRIKASSVSCENYIGVDNLLPNKGGKVSSVYVPGEGSLIEYHLGDILIGNIRPYLKKIWLATNNGGTNGDVLTIRIKDEVKRLLLPRYLYHVLASDIFFAYDMQHSKGAKMPRGDKKSVMKYEFPIPPLPVQQEIVRILDKFSALEAELEAELEAREKQYEYYKRKLFTFNDDVPRKMLGEIGKVLMCKRIFKEQTQSTGDIPFYKIGTFGKQPNAFISQDVFDEYKTKYSYPKKGDVLLSASGTIGRAVLFDGTPSYFQDSNIVWIDNNEKIVLNKYLYYYYSVAKWAVSEGGTIARLYNDNIKRTVIPVPPLSEQERIVAILDRFDVLVNDITQGLPAEIAARRKQYEYYRDQLLTFKEAAS